MFVGHLGAGLAAKAADHRINLGVFFAAALLLDALLWAMAPLGLERIIIPQDFAARHYLLFDFPWSHSLAATFGWAILAGAVTIALTRGAAREYGALIVALAVLSHWLLDVLVHPPELTLWGGASPRTGLALWDHQPWGLAAELAVAVAGLVLFWATSALSMLRRLIVAALTALVAALTIVGAYAPAPPPSATAAAATSLVAIAIVVLVGAFADNGARR